MVRSRSAPIGLSRGDQLALNREHVTDPVKWGTNLGTDFWFQAGANGNQTASGNNLLTDGGWTATAVDSTAGSAADFGSRSDPGTPGRMATGAASDLLLSPAIFGDYVHMHAAAVIAGMQSVPRYLVADAYAAFSVFSADEVTTNLGFVEDGGSIITAADVQATFYSKGTGATFNMQSNAAVVTGLVSADASYNWFRIILDRTAGYSLFYVNGTYNGTTPITADEFPLSFGAGVGAGGTNRIQLSQIHIFYAWDKPRDPAVF